MTGSSRLASATKHAAGWADTIRRPHPGLVVLAYHRVGSGSGMAVDLPTPLFAEQMAYLTSEATVVPLSEALLAVADSSNDRPLVAITFDDGTADFADTAFPVLADQGLPCTLYAATSYIESSSPFPHDGAPVSWAALRDAASTGLLDVGSHTHRHRLLDRLAADQLNDELDRSIELIADRLGIEARDFAYPKAVLGSHAAQGAVKARFRSAALAGTRANKFGATDPYRLSRSPVQVADGMRWFRKKVDGGLRLEDTLRSVVHRWRYRGLET